MTYVMTARPRRRAAAQEQPKTAPQPVRQQSVTITEKVTITRRSESRSHLLKDSEAWGWEEVRDYVVSQIEDRFGVFPRDQRKEAAIFKSFYTRYGAAAPIIAQYAFEVCEGYWKSAPVSVNRFCRGSDPYFAEVIIKALTD